VNKNKCVITNQTLNHILNDQKTNIEQSQKRKRIEINPKDKIYIDNLIKPEMKKEDIVPFFRRNLDELKKDWKAETLRLNGEFTSK
jgi:hypothetical protein